MPKVIIANSHSRSMVARPDDIPVVSRPIYSVISSRMLWLPEDHDVAVIAGPVDKDFLSYLGRILGVSVDTVTVRSLGDYAGIRWYPADNMELVAEIREHISASRFSRADWTLAYYIHDRDVTHWQRHLGLAADDHQPFAQDLAALVNSKSVFRTLALSSGTPVPEGCVVDRGRELVDVATELLSRTGSVVVKEDRNAGGDGNVLITTDPSVEAIGVFGTVTVAPGGDLRSNVRAALAQTTELATDLAEVPPGTTPAKYIVEVYHPGCRTLSAELGIPRHGAPVLLNYGDMRMEPVWNGYIFPPQDLPASLHGQLCADCQQIAVDAQALGYHGLMNIDAIVGTDNRILYTEFNGRAGGATNIDVIARRLLGPDYLHHYVVRTRNGLKSPRTLELAELLQADGIHFDPDRRSGIVIAADDTTTGTVEYIAIGRNAGDTARLEARLRAIVGADV